MNPEALPNGAALRQRLFRISLAISVVGLTIVLGCLHTLLDLTSAQWWWFMGMIGVYTLVTTYPNLRFTKRLLDPVSVFLDRRAAGGDVSDLRHAAFERVMDLPRRNGWVGGVSWFIPTVVVGVAMAVRFEQWGMEEIAVMLVAGTAAGFVAGSMLMFLTKMALEPIRTELSVEIEDPETRRRLIRPLSIRTKLLACVAGVSVVPVVFAVLLARADSKFGYETFTVTWQNALLDSIESRSLADDLGGDRAAAIQEQMGAERVFPAPVDAAVVDPTLWSDGLAPDWLDVHVREHIARALERNETRGDSRRFPAESAFAWRTVPDGRILIAATPMDALGTGGAGRWFVYGGLIVGSVFVAMILAYLIAHDVGSATQVLRTEADRLASGDLRRGRTFESEDEMGDLSRSFETMTESLRATVSRVAAAADQVESTAGEMAQIAESVATVTASQVTGIREAARSMEAIDRQVKDIAESSQALNVSVEESSSTILELGAAGEELNDTASVLSSKVAEVSSSIEQMVASVKQVSSNTEALSHAAVETSTSMEEMASSMREVDTSAEETARLSKEVVTSAESGQTKVRQTIEGMNAIREATETAEKVIRSLGKRTKEIGAIIDVIDDVADETNLLALNAAIIAAQAGEHGRALSVVADEIKDLADRVLASTKEIGNLISAVQEESSNAIGAIEQGTRSVASGVDLSAEAGVSLEAITRASRDSGSRIAGIVGAVREQAKAASHVAELMERVRNGVDEIRAAASEQERGNDVVFRSSIAMREVAQQVRSTTEEQAHGSGRIRQSVDGVRDAVEQINTSLQEQSAACRSVLEFLEEVSARTQANEVSARRMDEATKGLVREAESLRQDVHGFRI